MVQPTVTLEANTGTEAVPSWSTVGAAEELVYTKATMTGTTAQADIPFITKPASGTATAPQLWKGSSGAYTQVTVYDGTSNANLNVLRWSWTGAMNSPPIFTAYPTTAHGNPTAGDNSVLGGSAQTTNTSHLKGCQSATGLLSGWCTATTGTAGAVTATNTGQSLQGELQYLQLATTPGAAGNQRLNVLMYVSADEATGTFVTQFSCKYTWT